MKARLFAVFALVVLLGSLLVSGSSALEPPPTAREQKEIGLGNAPVREIRRLSPAPQQARVNTAWVIERVDTSRQFSYMGDRSLALDADGHPHIAYGENFLYYAWHDDTAWHLETVDLSPGVGSYTSLALDAADRPHISYWDSTNHDLKYAYNDGTSWHIETVDSEGNVGVYISLALDAADRPHISYYDYTNGDLKYAYHDGISWNIEAIDSAGDVGQYTSLVLDAGGYPHISYYDASFQDLKYAYKVCVAINEVQVIGPQTLLVGQSGTYQAIAQPITTSLPTTFTWDNGTVSPTAAYSWSLTGTYTLTVIGTNACGQGWGSLIVEILEEWPYNFYLPVVLRNE